MTPPDTAPAAPTAAPAKTPTADAPTATPPPTVPQAKIPLPSWEPRRTESAPRRNLNWLFSLAATFVSRLPRAKVTFGSIVSFFASAIAIFIVPPVTILLVTGANFGSLAAWLLAFRQSTALILGGLYLALCERVYRAGSGHGRGNENDMEVQDVAIHACREALASRSFQGETSGAAGRLARVHYRGDRPDPQ